MKLDNFLEEWVRLEGGEVERLGSSLTLLSPSCGLATFGLDASTGEDNLFLGHPYFEAALSQARQEDCVAIRHVEPTALKKDLPQRAAKAFSFRNAHIDRHETVFSRVVPWIFCHYRVTYLWDDKREELRKVGVDMATGAEVQSASLDRAWLEKGPLACERGSLPAELTRAQRYLERQIEPREKTLRADALRYQEVERSRLEHYYDAILLDLRRRANGKDKIDRTLAERDMRRRDLDRKFRLQVQARLFALEMIDIPRQVLPITLTSRRRSITLELTYNPILQDFDPLLCQGCLRSGRTFWYCTDGHRVCGECFAHCHHCNRGRCAACTSQPISKECLQCSGERPAVATSEPARSPAKQTIPPISIPVAVESPLERALEHFLHPADIRSVVQPADQLLGKGQVKEATAAMESFLREVPPRFELQREYLKQVIKALKLKRLDKVRAALVELAERSRAPGRPTARPEVAPQPTTRPESPKVVEVGVKNPIELALKAYASHEELFLVRSLDVALVKGKVEEALSGARYIAQRVSARNPALKTAWLRVVDCLCLGDLPSILKGLAAIAPTTLADIMGKACSSCFRPEGVIKLQELARAAEPKLGGIPPSVAAACLVYAHSNLTQRESAQLFDVKTSQVSSNYRRVSMMVLQAAL